MFNISFREAVLWESGDEAAMNDNAVAKLTREQIQLHVDTILYQAGEELHELGGIHTFQSAALALGTTEDAVRKFLRMLNTADALGWNEDWRSNPVDAFTIEMVANDDPPF